MAVWQGKCLRTKPEILLVRRVVSERHIQHHAAVRWLWFHEAPWSSWPSALFSSRLRKKCLQSWREEEEEPPAPPCTVPADGGEASDKDPSGWQVGAEIIGHLHGTKLYLTKGVKFAEIVLSWSCDCLWQRSDRNRQGWGWLQLCPGPPWAPWSDGVA